MKPNIFAEVEGHSRPFTLKNALVSKTTHQDSFASWMPNRPQQMAVNLLDIEFPIFEEATQTASRFLNAPICIVGIPSEETLTLKAAIGLSQLGLMNPLARTRRLPLNDKLAHYVLQTQQPLVLPKIADHEPFAQSCLVQAYGIEAYLGVPLITTDGSCLGCLSVMDTAPHDFSSDAIAFIELLARWSVSEYERYILSEKLVAPELMTKNSLEVITPGQKTILDTVRLTLMSQLTQEMRNPLTTITGMANILSREIYGSLTPKQRKYAEIVHNSSQTLLGMANDVLELSSLGTSLQPLNFASVDLEMLGQYVQRNLASIADENNQEISFTVEPSSRLWKLDKDLVRHLLQHLIYSVVKLSGEGGTIRIHASERDECLNITVWHSHPWLGEGLPTAVRELSQFLNEPDQEVELLLAILARVTGHTESKPIHPSQDENDTSEGLQETMVLKARETLSLLLSRQLIEHHGGTLNVQSNSGSGDRFLVVLPPT